MAEAILRHFGQDRFEVFSAGSHPAGFVHPLAVEAMRRLNVPMQGHVSKSWDEFANRPMDVVITVCDAAAGQSCPLPYGNSLTVHWPLPDPVFHPGTDEERVEFAVRVARRLLRKIQGLVEMDLSADAAQVQSKLESFGDQTSPSRSDAREDPDFV